MQFRRELGLFASVRPLKNLRGLPARFQGVDMLVIRELTEDLYAAIEHEIVPGVVQSIKVVTEAASRRFFRFAFDWAQERRPQDGACVHKANILKLADGLFLEAFRAAAREFPELQTREIIVDNCCMQMVSRPQQFDVMVMGNLYGDLVSDLGAGVVGGVSATHGINVGDGVRVYESFHGGSREAIGVDRANPLPLLLPAIDLLEGVGEKEAARRILAAVEKVLTEGQGADARPRRHGHDPRWPRPSSRASFAVGLSRLCRLCRPGGFGPHRKTSVLGSLDTFSARGVNLKRTKTKVSHNPRQSSPGASKAPVTGGKSSPGDPA